MDQRAGVVQFLGGRAQKGDLIPEFSFRFVLVLYLRFFKLSVDVAEGLVILSFAKRALSWPHVLSPKQRSLIKDREAERGQT
jgi:hypothetical protein